MLATNWATLALGASATANSAGYWCVTREDKKRVLKAGLVAAFPSGADITHLARRAGYTAEPRFALDDDPESYWSSTGGAVRSPCGNPLRVCPM